MSVNIDTDNSDIGRNQSMFQNRGLHSILLINFASSKTEQTLHLAK